MLKGRMLMKQVLVLITALVIGAGILSCDSEFTGPNLLIPVTGVVLDSATGAPLDSVFINSKDTLTSTSIAMTDSTGKFGPEVFLPPIALIFRRAGYSPKVVTIINPPGRIDSLTVLMAPGGAEEAQGFLRKFLAH
jgi:hypothetical protein